MPESVNCILTTGGDLLLTGSSGISMQHVKIEKWDFIPLLKEVDIWGKKRAKVLF